MSNIETYLPENEKKNTLVIEIELYKPLGKKGAWNEILKIKDRDEKAYAISTRPQKQKQSSSETDEIIFLGYWS